MSGSRLIILNDFEHILESFHRLKWESVNWLVIEVFDSVNAGMHSSMF